MRFVAIILLFLIQHFQHQNQSLIQNEKNMLIQQSKDFEIFKKLIVVWK